MGNPYRDAKLGLRALIVLAALAASPMAASASALQVDPVKLEISAERKIASVRVRNDGDAPVTIHGYALSWSQHDGEDVSAEVASLIISPPIFTIPAGGTQLIRVGLRPPAAATGAAYRLILEEVPEAHPGGGVQVTLRLNIPLFAMEKAGTGDDLSWAAWRQAGGAWVIEATNRGTGYVRVEPSEASARTGIRFDANLLLGVVLPGSSKKWVLAAATVTDRATFEHIARAPVSGQATPVQNR
jgi:fimbrial chaperone protein